VQDVGECVVLALRDGAVIFVAGGCRVLGEDELEGFGGFRGEQPVDAVHPVEQRRDPHAAAGEPALLGVGGAFDAAGDQQCLGFFGQIVRGHVLCEFEQRGFHDLGVAGGDRAHDPQDHVRMLGGELAGA